ncbi:MAG: agmatinase [Alsobacter sp.]
MNDTAKRPMPISGMELARYSGHATFMRLPHIPLDQADGLEIGLFGLPWDGGTTTRNGSRYGPRQVREMSTLLRSFHPVLKMNPYLLARCADIGDAPTNPIEFEKTLGMLEAFVGKVVAKGLLPLAIGGDHFCSFPMLRVLGKGQPLGMVHFDAHTDMYDTYYDGTRYTHSTHFRRAIEEGLLDPTRVVQIGIRGTAFAEDEHDWCFAQGVRHIGMDFLREKGPQAVVAEIRAIVGEGPCYLSLDIDALDPSCAPGTGVPEIGGITSYEAQVMLRSLRGMDFVGADLVEVSPPLDPSGTTALVAANLAFEMLCLLADRVAAR